MFTIEYTRTESGQVHTWLEDYSTDEAFNTALDNHSAGMQMTFAHVPQAWYHFVVLRPEYDFDDGMGYNPARYSSELVTSKVTPTENGEPA